MAEMCSFKMPHFFHSEVVKLFLQHEIPYKMYANYDETRLGKMPEFTSQILGHPTMAGCSQLPETNICVVWWLLALSPCWIPIDINTAFFAFTTDLNEHHFQQHKVPSLHCGHLVVYNIITLIQKVGQLSSLQFKIPHKVYKPLLPSKMH